MLGPPRLASPLSARPRACLLTLSTASALWRLRGRGGSGGGANASGQDKQRCLLAVVSLSAQGHTAGIVLGVSVGLANLAFLYILFVRTGGCNKLLVGSTQAPSAAYSAMDANL